MCSILGPGSTVETEQEMTKQTRQDTSRHGRWDENNQPHLKDLKAFSSKFTEDYYPYQQKHEKDRKA